jgi:hypothetical protein
MNGAFPFCFSQPLYNTSSPCKKAKEAILLKLIITDQFVPFILLCRGRRKID